MPILIALLALSGGVVVARGTWKSRGKALDDQALIDRFQAVMNSGNPAFMRSEATGLYNMGYIDASEQLFARAKSIDGLGNVTWAAA